MKDRILEMLKELRPEFEFEEDVDFIEEGYLDSFDLTTLISDMESEFGCLIDPMEIRAENFGSVDAMVALIEKSK